MLRISTIVILLMLFTFGVFAQNNISNQQTIPEKPVYSTTFLNAIEKNYYVSEALKKHKIETPAIAPELKDTAISKKLKKIEKAIPFTCNSQVISYIQLYTVDKRIEISSALGLYEEYKTVFKNALKKYNLPEELALLPLVKSAMNPSAVSPTGASGIWQLNYSISKHYGIRIDSYVDDRRDVEKSTEVACKLLKNYYEVYNDWLVALAAFNCGPANVNKAIRRSGNKVNFWDFYAYLPADDRDYVPAFIAINYVLAYKGEYKIKPLKISLPEIADTVPVHKKIHLIQISEVLKLPIEEVKIMNPQYKLDIIPLSDYPQFVILREGFGKQFTSFEDSISRFNDTVLFRLVRSEKKALPIEPESITTDSLSTDSNGTIIQSQPIVNQVKIYYTVKSGDNLGMISGWFDATIPELQKWNNLKGTSINVGQKLAVYVPKSKETFYKSIDKMSASQKKSLNGSSSAKPQQSTPPATKPKTEKPATNTGEWTTYTVKQGDTIYKIAKKYPGVTDKDIIKWNNISNPSNLKIGQKLKIKKQ